MGKQSESKQPPMQQQPLTPDEENLVTLIANMLVEKAMNEVTMKNDLLSAIHLPSPGTPSS